MSILKLKVDYTTTPYWLDGTLEYGIGDHKETEEIDLDQVTLYPTPIKKENRDGFVESGPMIKALAPGIKGLSPGDAFLLESMRQAFNKASVQDNSLLGRFQTHHGEPIVISFPHAITYSVTTITVKTEERFVLEQGRKKITVPEKIEKKNLRRSDLYSLMFVHKRWIVHALQIEENSIWINGFGQNTWWAFVKNEIPA